MKHEPWRRRLGRVAKRAIDFLADAGDGARDIFPDWLWLFLGVCAVVVIVVSCELERHEARSHENDPRALAEADTAARAWATRIGELPLFVACEGRPVDGVVYQCAVTTNVTIETTGEPRKVWCSLAGCEHTSR